MALTAPDWYHDGAQLDQVSPSGATRSNPGSTGDPTVSSGSLIFDITAPGDSLQFANTSAVFSGGTGDLTLAWRGQIHTSQFNGNTLIMVGGTSRRIAIRQKSSANLTLVGVDPAIGSDVVSTNNAFAVNTTFTVVVRRASGAWTIWVDGSNVTATDTLTTRDFNTTPYDDVLLGSDAGGTLADATMEFAAVWDSAVLDADIPSITEANLDAFFGASDTTPPTYGTAPAVDSTTPTTVTVDATASDETDSTVNHYAVAVADAATAPSAAQVKAGQDSTGSAAIASGSDAGVSNAAEGSITLTGLTASTAYDIYYVVEDQSANLTTVTKLDATTAALPTITTSALKQNNGTVIASQTGIIANVYNLSTGALVVRKTGLSSDGSGVVSFSDAAMSAATEYGIHISYDTGSSVFADGFVRLTTA